MSIFDVDTNVEDFDEVILIESLSNVAKNDVPAFFQAWRDIIYACLVSTSFNRNKLSELYMVIEEWRNLRPTEYSVYLDIEDKPFVGADTTNVRRNIFLILNTILSAHQNEEDYFKLINYENWEILFINIMCERSVVRQLDAGAFRNNYKLQPFIYKYDEWDEVESKYDLYKDSITKLLELKHNIKIDWEA
jgi:hypothetical protein